MKENVETNILFHTIFLILSSFILVTQDSMDCNVFELTLWFLCLKRKFWKNFSEKISQSYIITILKKIITRKIGQKTAQKTKVEQKKGKTELLRG